MKRSKLLIVLIFAAFALSFISSQATNDSETSCFTKTNFQNFITAKAYAAEPETNKSEADEPGTFVSIVSLVLIIGMIAFGMYALNKWRIWIWGFKTGTADSSEFVGALKWTGITGVFILLFCFLGWLIS
jgi:hypothetical protein